ncbi:MAG: hypothetical protein KatS3mg002_0003 [Candidatus Woesearchaeota archaeon]|nr:MAG: hypothetical protein KatS3mg002_0003 [Candidatus Woesearchaeota archaeon]
MNIMNNFRKFSNIESKKSYKIILLIMFIALFVLSGCSKVYVCYDGTTQKIASKCPTIPRAEVSEQEAGKAVDNYGNAIAQAKGEQYTRINLYQQNKTWYSGALFINKQTQTIHQVTFKIDGKTATVSCQTGCDYISFE